MGPKSFIVFFSLSISLVYKMRCSTEIIFCYLVPGSICEMNKHQWHLNRLFLNVHTYKNYIDEYKFAAISIMKLCKNRWLQRNWPPDWFIPERNRVNSTVSWLKVTYAVCCLRSFTPCIAFNISRKERANIPCNLFICKISYVITIKTIFGRENGNECAGKKHQPLKIPVKNVCLKKKIKCTIPCVKGVFEYCNSFSAFLSEKKRRMRSKKREKELRFVQSNPKMISTNWTMSIEWVIQQHWPDVNSYVWHFNECLPLF